MKIEITRDFRHWRKGFVFEPPAMLREYLLKVNVAKRFEEEQPKAKRRGRPRKSNTSQNRSS